MATYAHMQTINSHVLHTDPITQAESVDTTADIHYLGGGVNAVAQITVRTTALDTSTTIALKWSNAIIDYANSQDWSVAINRIVIFDFGKGIAV